MEYAMIAIPSCTMTAEEFAAYAESPENADTIPGFIA